jgi:hypothetical protein
MSIAATVAPRSTAERSPGKPPLVLQLGFFTGGASAPGATLGFGGLGVGAGVVVGAGAT